MVRAEDVLVRPELGGGYPGVPFYQDWPRLRFPLDTWSAWDRAMENRELPARVSEEQAITWCHENGHSYVWTGPRDAHVPCAALGFVLAMGYPVPSEENGPR